MQEAEPQIQRLGKPPGAGTLLLKSTGAGRVVAIAELLNVVSALPATATVAAAALYDMKVRRSMKVLSDFKTAGAG
tara:strand:- start:2037 stop:2264 length:228 start_codon:yes stop_codon:yes gene_type:complete